MTTPISEETLLMEEAGVIISPTPTGVEIPGSRTTIDLSQELFVGMMFCADAGSTSKIRLEFSDDLGVNWSVLVPNTSAGNRDLMTVASFTPMPAAAKANVMVRAMIQQGPQAQIFVILIRFMHN